MADNVVLNVGTGGDTVAADDIGGIKYQRVKTTWGSDGTATDVDATNPLPTSLNASIFRFSTNNSSSAELASNATFTGTIETALDQPSISLLMTSDQPITLTVYQYIDASGVYAVPPIVYYVPANQGLSASFALNGNYVKVTAKNTGTATTTTFELNTAYGNLPASDGSGRLPVSKADCIQLLNTTITTTGPGTSIDTVGYGAVVVQLSGTWQGFGIFEASNDGTTWDSILTFSRDNLSLIDLVTSGGLYTIRPSGRYIRFNVTQLTGTIAINAQGRSAEGIAASDLLSLAMDRANNTPLHIAPSNEVMGQQPMAQSMSVALATELTDTQVARYSYTGAIPLGTILSVVDCTKVRSLSIMTSAVGTGGAFLHEWSNDGVTWLATQLVLASSGTPISTFTSGSIYTTNVFGRYFRTRVQTAQTSGTTAAVICGFRELIGCVQVASASNTGAGLYVQQPTAANLNATVNLATLNGGSPVIFSLSTAATAASFNLGVCAGGASNASTEVTSAARTTTGNSGTISDAGGAAVSAVITVTAAGGTTPTLDIALQESYDGGTTWQDVYHCERLTANGTLVVPPVQVYGRRRWAWTITGTTPTFTFPISVSRGGFGSQPVFRQFFDRTAGLLSGTLNATSSSYQTAGCKFITAAITIGAATTGGTYKIQGSADGTNFYDISGTVVAVANSTVQVTSSAQVTARFCRVICSSAATGQTGTVVAITGTE